MILCDNPMYASQFVECYTGKYFFKCDTFGEMKNCLASEHIYVGDGVKLTDADKLESKAPYVLVMFSKEDDYTEHEWRFMRIQKKYLARFKRNMAGMDSPAETE